MAKTVTVFKKITATSAGFYRDLEWVLDRIKNGHSKETIGLIRIEKDKKKRDALKMELPSICFSGTFKTRAISGLKKHSGLICLDFDAFPDEDTLQAWRDTLEGDEYTMALFTSPSGNGLKVIVQIPEEPENHKAYFDALKKHYDCEYFDVSTSDVSRVCYQSWDEDLVYNPDALIWIEKEEIDLEEVVNVVPTVKVKSESRIINVLHTWWTKKFGSNKGSRNSNLYKFAASLNDYGVDKMEAENHLLQFAQDDFPSREIQKIVSSAYSKTEAHGTKFLEDHVAKSKIEKMVRTGKNQSQMLREMPKLTKEEMELAVGDVKDNMSITDFWEYNDKGKIVISPHKYKLFLEQNQLFKFFPEGSNSFVFVQIESNLLSDTSPQRIKDFILSYLMNRSDIGFMPYDYMANQTRLFKEDYLSMLDTANVQLKEDTADSCFIYYKNCALEVKKDGVEKIDYVDLDGFVWEHHVIDRDFDQIVKKKKGETGMYEKFVWLAANKDQQRFNSLRSVAGYLMHSYKTSANNKAIIFNDETVTDNPNGGSGKGLFCNGVSQMKRVSVLDGKQFNFEKSFAYQTVSTDTQVLLFDDVKKNFAFENLFSLITEGITLEKKNKDAIHIPVQKSPKIVINTNYTIGGIGGSFERRKFEVEMSDYFGYHHTPADEFGCMLFDDWSDEEWVAFDCFMIECIQYYLENGLVAHEFNNLELRKFIKETCSEFNEWSSDRDNLKIGQRLDKKGLFEDFTDQYSDYKKKLTQRTFTKWLESFGKKNDYDTTQGKSHNRWIMFNEKGNDKDPDF